MKRLLGAGVLAGVFTAPAFAQSNLTMYGIIDAGIDYVNNSGGHSLFQMQNGVAQGSRWGLKGIEDIGGGTRVVFTIENGFNVFNGKTGNNGAIFGRQAYLGFANDAWGTLTLGRQYDPVVNMIQPTTFNGQGGAFFSHPSDVDNTDNSIRVNNAVKYVSPNWGGLTGSVMYGFGGVAGSFRKNSTIAAGASYANGPLYLGAAYFYARDPADQFTDANFQPNGTPGISNGEGVFGYVGHPANMQTMAAGGSYKLGDAQIGLSFSDVRFDDASGIAGNTVRFDNYEAWAVYHLSPMATIGGGYTFTLGKIDFNGAKPKYHQGNLLFDYALSKRTDTYLMAIYQYAAGGANADIYQAFAGSESTTRSQVALRIGMRHKF